MTRVKPCLGPPQLSSISRVRCPEYALPGKSRCRKHHAEFEAARRANPNLTGRRGTNAAWRRARGLALYIAKNKCRRCGKTSDLEVHHKDKDSTNNEQSNLRVLCGNCHRIEG